MKLDEFRKHESIEFWMDQLATRRKSTREAYLGDFRHFCEWLGQNPDEILDQRKKEMKNYDQEKKHHYEVKLKRYIANLNEKGLSFATQKSKYEAVKSFFASHYVRLDLRRTDAPSGESIGSRIPEKSEVRRMMDLAPDLKWRALISFLKDCGWRIGDVRKLTWGDLKKPEENWWYCVKVTEKEKVRGVGIIGPETTELLTLYKKQREERGEKVQGDSLLFPSRFGGVLRVEPISLQISRLAKTANAENVTAHSLRKFFRANLELHVPNTWIKTMMRKKIAGSTGAYTENRPEKLLEAYKKAYDALRLEEGSKLTPEEERRVKEMTKIMKAIETKGKDEDWNLDLTELEINR